jgi:hypothetical protein
MIKRLKTWLYKRYGKEPEYAVFSTFTNIQPKGDVLPLKPTQIYEDAGIWKCGGALNYTDEKPKI